MKDKGVIVFAAAGNDGIENGSKLKSGKFVYSFPASYDSVISVAATGVNGKITSFSNYGKLIDLAAPGEKIVSTKLGGGYKSMSGTSMATPVVAASYALALLNLKSQLRSVPVGYKLGYNRAYPLLKTSIRSAGLDSSHVLSRGILSMTNLMSSLESVSFDRSSAGFSSSMSIAGTVGANASSSTVVMGVTGIPAGTKQIYFYWGSGKENVALIEVGESSQALYSLGQFALFGSGSLTAVAVDGAGNLLAQSNKSLQGLN